MIDASVQSVVKSQPILPLTTTLGPVHIAVTDRARALIIWQDVVGLDLLDETANVLTLGAGGKPLIVLETGAIRPSVQRSIGLYHVAIHVPQRVDLAQMAVRMPVGTRIGHVHVHVNDLHMAMDFYRDVIGFAGFLLIHSFGMGDVGLDYMPHTVAFNIWSGPNAGLPAAGSAGLRWFTIVVPDLATLEGVQARLVANNAPVASIVGGIETQDPFGNRIQVLVA